MAGRKKLPRPQRDKPNWISKKLKSGMRSQKGFSYLQWPSPYLKETHPLTDLE
jgi:hypothetical protein